MEADIESVVKLVRSYAESMYISNSIVVYLDKTGAEFKNKNVRGDMDSKMLRIILNGPALEGELFKEYAASVISFFQPPAYMMEAVRAYKRREADDIRLDPQDEAEEKMEEIIESSLVLPGVCKKAELDIMSKLGRLHGYEFSKIESEVMGSIADEKEIDKITEEDLHEMGMSKTSFSELNRGFRIYESLQAKANEIQYKRKDELLKACLIVASESGDFDREFGRFATDYTIEDIFAKARLVPIPIPRDVTKLDDAAKEGFLVLGRKKRVTVGEIKPSVIKLHESPSLRALDITTVRSVGDILEKLSSHSSEEDYLTEDEEKHIREVYNGLENFTKRFKEHKV